MFYIVNFTVFFFILFSGSHIENWHSILRNGLVVASNTRLQVNRQNRLQLTLCMLDYILALASFQGVSCGSHIGGKMDDFKYYLVSWKKYFSDAIKMKECVC